VSTDRPIPFTFSQTHVASHGQRLLDGSSAITLMRTERKKRRKKETKKEKAEK